tara:strand:+ start:87 stop:557 length:471 start_codon:yes stop_codon:yes gene_type:complete
MAIPLVPLAILGGAGVAANQIRKAGERRQIAEIIRRQKDVERLLGSPTGGFDTSATGYGPGMVFNPLSNYQTLLRYQTQMGDQQRDNFVKNLAAIEPFTDRSKRRDFERNMAAARFRNQLATQQGLTLQGQVGAQALAQQAQGAAGQALASNYQYQ